MVIASEDTADDIRTTVSRKDGNTLTLWFHKGAPVGVEQVIRAGHVYQLKVDDGMFRSAWLFI